VQRPTYINIYCMFFAGETMRPYWATTAARSR
jgi:hypothetical protein